MMMMMMMVTTIETSSVGKNESEIMNKKVVELFDRPHHTNPSQQMKRNLVKTKYDDLILRRRRH